MMPTTDDGEQHVEGNPSDSTQYQSLLVVLPLCTSSDEKLLRKIERLLYRGACRVTSNRRCDEICQVLQEQSSDRDATANKYCRDVEKNSGFDGDVEEHKTDNIVNQMSHSQGDREVNSDGEQETSSDEDCDELYIILEEPDFGNGGVLSEEKDCKAGDLKSDSECHSESDDTHHDDHNYCRQKDEIPDSDDHKKTTEGGVHCGTNLYQLEAVDKQSNVESKRPTIKEQLKCQYCENLYVSQYKMMMHHKTKHKVRKAFQCAHCDKTFFTFKGLNSHGGIHNRRFECKYCKKSFSTKPIMKEHEAMHTRPNKFKCEQCGNGFTHKWKLKYHFEVVHSGIRPYGCNQCNKTFPTSRHLSKHRACHTGKTNILCTECGASFRTILGFKGHQRKHTGEHPYICRYCGKTFAYLNGVTEHERVHQGDRPYKCKYCEITFRTYASMRKHQLRIHLGEKRHQCTYCGKTFVEHYAMKIHERRHTRVKPYKCNYCEKTFSCTMNKSHHVKVHHTSA